MAYQEDKSIAPEHAAAEIGEKISWAGRAIDGIGGMIGAIPNYTVSLFNVIPGGLADTIGLGAAETGQALSAVGITGLAPALGGMVAAGEGLKALDDLSHGEMVKAGKHMVVGSAKAGVVFLDGFTMGLAEIPSLLFTGKFLSTNVGEVVGQMLDGADRNVPATSNLATVGYMDPQVAAMQPPPAEVRQTAPYGMQAPEGGWQNYVAARRNQGIAQPQQGEVQQGGAVMSGNPQFANAVEIARNAAAGNGAPQVNG